LHVGLGYRVGLHVWQWVALYGEGGLLALYKYNAVNNVDPCIQTAIQQPIDSESISPTAVCIPYVVFGLFKRSVSKTLQQYEKFLANTVI